MWNSFHAWLEHWKPLADWIVAAGTLLIAALAVFGGRIERWWRYPDLSIETEPKFVGDTFPGEGPRILALLCVKNGAGVAESAEIFLETVSRKGSGKGGIPMKDIVPLSFRWIHGEPEKPEIFVTIAAGMRRYWMLGAMKHRNSSSKVYFQLFTERKLMQSSDELDPGEYILNVTIAAANAKPRSTKISITVPSEFEEPKITSLY